MRRSLRNINHTNSHQSEAIELEKKHVDPQVEFWSPVKLEKQESCDDPNSGDTKENVEAVQLDKFLMAHGYAFKPNKVSFGALRLSTPLVGLLIFPENFFSQKSCANNFRTHSPLNITAVGCKLFHERLSLQKTLRLYFLKKKL